MADKITLRDLMEVTKKINDTANDIRETLNKEIITVDNKADFNKEQIAVINTKISAFAVLQLTISVILSAIATYLGAVGIK